MSKPKFERRMIEIRAASEPAEEKNDNRGNGNSF